MIKKILANLQVYLLGSLGGLVLYCIYKSIKWSEVRIAPDEPHHFEGPARILAFWHGRQLMIPPSYAAFHSKAKNPIYALISMHTDGRTLAHGIRMLGVHSIAGSSSKGGKEASRLLVQHLKAGDSISITPDGPTGPIYQVKPGIIKIAHSTGVGIVPLSCSASRYWTIASWDKMMIPKPFSRGVIVVGKTLYIEESLSDDTIHGLTDLVNNSLNEVQAYADNYFS